jgi:hypothetical protein
MPKLIDPVCLLLAPGILLLGALLQIVIARIWSARANGPAPVLQKVHKLGSHQKSI